MLISEIARQANVSPATVSRVINQPELVAPERQARVQAVIAQNGYTPTPLQRRRGPKSRLPAPKRLGVWFVGAHKTPHLRWFQDQLLQLPPPPNQQRIDLAVLYSDSPEDIPTTALERELDGLILQGMEPSQNAMRQIAEIPKVWFMTRRTLDYPGDYVEPDNEANGRMAAEYLHAQGHKRVAAVSADASYSTVARRVSAFLARAAELNMPSTSILGQTASEVSYVLGDSHQESADLAQRIKSAKHRPTGLYLPVDHFCGSFFRELRLVGLRAEHDYEAILGNYNPVIYRNLDTQPAAIDINLPTLVHKVIEHLLWRIENPRAAGRVACTISPTLIPSRLEVKEKPPSFE